MSYSYNASFEPSPVMLIVILALCAVMFISMWKIFVKAGEHGWAIFVPFYGNFCQFRMCFGNGWMFLLMLVPIVNFIVMVMTYFKMAKVFGKGSLFAVGLMFLPFIFLPVLAFGDAEYEGV